MMRRYVRHLARVSIGTDHVDTWQVIETEEVPHEEVIAREFEPIPEEMTTAEVLQKYGTDTIYVVRDSRLTNGGVN